MKTQARQKRFKRSLVQTPSRPEKRASACKSNCVPAYVHIIQCKHTNQRCSRLLSIVGQCTASACDYLRVSIVHEANILIQERRDKGTNAHPSLFAKEICLCSLAHKQGERHHSVISVSKNIVCSHVKSACNLKGTYLQRSVSKE